MKTLIKISAGVFAVLSFGCDKGVDSFSLLPASASFTQSVAYEPRKVDILWVVDSSGSMQSSQTALAANFASFITGFQAKNLDFQMAVTDTGAYYGNYPGYGNPYSKFRDGSSSHSGVFIMDKNTPNLSNVFTTNVTVGINGTGDERAFSSFVHALGNPLNAGFHRPGAILIVIIVSDEEDFSHNDWSPYNYFFTENLAHPSIMPISTFVNYLTTFTGSTPQTAASNFVVHNISILDAGCLATLNNSSQKISVRYPQLSAATGGLSFSLCANMAGILDALSQQALTLASKFQLTREPWPDSIVVTVNGVNVPQNGTNGWTYDPTTWTISFFGTAIPAADANVQINFEPMSPQI